MNLTRYRYTGPLSAVSLRVGGKLLDVQLLPGALVNLPDDHDYTKVLLELKHLHLEPAAVAPGAGKKGEKTNGS